MKKQFLVLEVDGVQIADHVALCDDMESRHVGLLGRGSLELGEGVLMTMPWPRSGGFGLLTSIHMVGMKFPIAVAWINRNYQVVDAKLASPGGLIYATWKPASFILEVHPDHLVALTKGARAAWKLVS